MIGIYKATYLMLYRHQIYDIIKDKMVVMGVFMIQTERLKIYAASNGEMKKFIEAQCVDALKEAYTEMMCGCIKHPEQRGWYAIWMIELKNGTHIGELCFKGLGADGMVEIGYGVSEEYEGKGYATEAVSAVVRWAIDQPGVARIEAETEAENIASQRVLEKCGFIATGSIGEEGPRFVWNPLMS